MADSRIRSFGRTTGRLTSARRRLLDAEGSRFLLDVPYEDDQIALADSWRFDPAAAFGRVASLVIEVGSGDGEQAVAYAAAHPETDVLAVEIFWEGIASAVGRALEAGVTNLRILRADASLELGRSIPPGSAREVWTFFPDPWPKARHHKRRLVNAAFADAVASVLAPGGVWRLATDWEDYADQMREVLAGEDRLERDPAASAEGVSLRFSGRVVTRYERKAREAGRAVRDFVAVRA